MAQHPKKLNTHGIIITLDGPAGAGKSTVSQLLAATLKGRVLDTGGMYRTVAFFAMAHGLTKASDIARLARRCHFSVNRNGKVLIDRKPLPRRIRSLEVTEQSSRMSQFRQVRQILTRWQRKLGKDMARHQAVVVEGRDIGTVVFPDAPFKFFVTASATVRARRRMLQLRSEPHGNDVPYRHILKSLRERDERDSSRKTAPLRCPEDAVIVDTSRKEIAEVVDFIRTHIFRKLEWKRDHGQ